jgi:RimJ/RimL family protein N-acetyltransferase
VAVDDGPLPIRTDRLVLRRFRAADRDAFLVMRRHPDVARHQSWDEDFSDAAADAFFAEMLAVPFWRPGAWFQVAIEHDGAFVGDVAFWPDPDEQLVEIGYSLHPDHQRKGYAIEAVAALVRALRDHGAQAVVAGCDVGNERSAHLLERLGFTFTGIEDGERIYRLAIAGTATFGP